MKKVNSLSESCFLKALFGFFALVFLATALLMPDRDQIFTGLYRLISPPNKITPT